MKKAFYITILIIFSFGSISYSQCLCGDAELKVLINDLSFENENSNYELIVIEKPKKIAFDTKILTKRYFSRDTLKLKFGTGAGINKLKIELKNKTNASSMRITILNMTYDNDYYIDLSQFTSGDYIFNWEKIDSCQSLHRTSTIVECKGMKFAQINLQKTNSRFNNNEIKVLDLKYFRNKDNNSSQLKNNEKRIEIKERIESLFSSEIDNIYHLEKDKYLFTQRNVSGNGNHYYDEIIMRIISFSENKITLYPLNIETKEDNGYLDENGFLIVSQHQLFDFKDKMLVNYDEVTKILSYQFHSMNIQSWETATFKEIQYKFVNGKFELISENYKEVKL